MEEIKAICQNPIFGVFLSLTMFEISVWLYKKSNKFLLLNPLPVTVVFLILFLLIFDIPYESYAAGGQYITSLISPITVALAVPLYMQRETLKKNALVIIASIAVGSIVAIASMCAFQMLFPMDEVIFASILPRSVTTAIAVELSAQFGGLPAITVIAVLVAGLTGALLAPTMSKVFKIKNDISIGLAIGTSSHAFGTTKAFEMGERIGAMSSLSIGIAGVITVFVAPFIVKLFGLL